MCCHWRHYLLPKQNNTVILEQAVTPTNHWVSQYDCGDSVTRNEIHTSLTYTSECK